MNQAFGDFPTINNETYVEMDIQKRSTMQCKVTRKIELKYL